MTTACVTASRDLAHLRRGERALCGAMTAPVLRRDDPCYDDDHAEEARAAAKLPACARCAEIAVE